MRGFSDPETKHWSDGALQASIWRGGYSADILDDLFGYFQPESQIGTRGQMVHSYSFFRLSPQTSNSRTQTHTNIRPVDDDNNDGVLKDHNQEAGWERKVGGAQYWMRREGHNTLALHRL